MVIRAVVVNGMLKPLAGLPGHIKDGSEVAFELVAEGQPLSPERRQEIEAWYQRLQELDSTDEGDQELLQKSLDEQRALAKKMAARE